LRFLRLDKFVHFAEELVEGQSLFAQLADEAAEGCESTCEALDMDELSWPFHGHDCSNFIRVGLYPSFGDEVTEKLPGGYAEGALFQIELDAVPVEVVECLPKVINESVRLL
jgi:hypothetical protein